MIAQAPLDFDDPRIAWARNNQVVLQEKDQSEAAGKQELLDKVREELHGEAVYILLLYSPPVYNAPDALHFVFFLKLLGFEAVVRATLQVARAWLLGSKQVTWASKKYWCYPAGVQ